MKVTSPESPGSSNMVLAITRASPGCTQLLAGPEAVPSAATASFVPAWTITRLCWLLADGLLKVMVTSEPESAVMLSVSKASVSPTAPMEMASGPVAAGVSVLPVAGVAVSAASCSSCSV